MERSKCRTCQADILWCRTAATGALIPVDAEPVEGGNIALIDSVAHVIKNDLFEPTVTEGPRYRSHFASCPNSEMHRKKKRGKDQP